ncbi:protease [Legionella geestiana]|uniref:Protein QmcA n=1 Tax=Legionella geestiana TaxID=45065 RepID=A0A0W0U349_9GAMM|nr:SPFH domain-containing protein [Legionella geestiana]KTD02328.1 protease [Legionella geestiana]STX53074.1 protease [Legionella geestiana]
MESLITLGLLALFAVILVLAGVKAVPQSEEWTVERFGRYTHTLAPGLALIIPFIDRIGYRVNKRERVLDIPPQEIISSDNAMVTIDAVCFFQVVDVAKSAYQVENLELAIRNLTMTNIRTVLGSLELDAMLSQRDGINNKLMHVVDQATSPWGVKVTRIEIRDIRPPKNLVDAMANQMKAEREKRAAILSAEGDRQAEILRAEGLKQGQILGAEADRQQAFLAAEARERTAEAEANATRMLSEAIAAGNMNAVNYFVAEKYLRALEAIGRGENAKTVFLPMEASGILGALGGLKEMLKEQPGR